MHRQFAAFHQHLILPRALLLPGQLLLAQLADRFCRATDDQMVGGHLRFRLHERRGADDAVLTNDGAVHHHRVHAHQRIAADHTAVKDRAVANMPVLFHYRVLLRETVHDAVILNVRPVFHHDTAEITAQAGIGADINAFAQNHVANQHRRWVYIALVRHHRRQTVNLINWHPHSLCACQTAKALIVVRAGHRQFADGGFALLADKRQRPRCHTLINIDAELSGALPGPVRRQ